MELHEAIEKLLKEEGRAMTTAEITAALNEKKWYTKKDESEICEFQVHGRTHSLSGVFKRDGLMVALKKKS